MLLDDAIRSRRSVRGLRGDPLAAALVAELVELAVRAPAPHHTKLWRFVDVSVGRRESFADAMGTAWRSDMELDGVPPAQQRAALARSRGRIIGAPTLLVGCLVGDELVEYADERRRTAEWTMAAHAFGAALQNLLLGAHARGLGAYWISAPLYAQAAVIEALALDPSWRPQAAIALGEIDPAYEPFEREPLRAADCLVQR